MVEYGIVRFFDEREGKKYGFLSVLDRDGEEIGEEIFFHFNDGQFVSTDDIDVYFDGSMYTEEGRVTRLRAPRRDDRLVFERAQGSKGVVAKPWTYANMWDEQQKLLQALVADADDDPEESDSFEDDEDYTSIATVRSRALVCFGGDAELVREAIKLYPGDFI